MHVIVDVHAIDVPDPAPAPERPNQEQLILCLVPQLGAKALGGENGTPDEGILQPAVKAVLDGPLDSEIDRGGQRPSLPGVLATRRKARRDQVQFVM